MDGFRRTLVLAGALLVSAAPTALAANPAQQWPANGAAMQQARAIAVAHWGVNPCKGHASPSAGRSSIRRRTRRPHG
jgi:Spy/CpxP family protein refolding chaperone